jgi:dienelactone hydrolase
MVPEIVRYQADELAMVSHLYLPDEVGPGQPGILVFPEAFGLGDHAKARAERLAKLGYVALACDLHGDAQILSDLADVMGAIGPLLQEPARIRARALGGLKALCARVEVDSTRVAAIGYCFGGTMSLELARGGADIGCTVGFHCGLGTVAPDDAANIKGKVMVCIGADDPGIPPEQRAAFENEMRAGGVDWQMHLYGGVVHSFTNPDADEIGRPEFARYDARADSRSWRSMLDLFDSVFVTN